MAFVAAASTCVASSRGQRGCPRVRVSACQRTVAAWPSRKDVARGFRVGCGLNLPPRVWPANGVIRWTDEVVGTHAHAEVVAQRASTISRRAEVVEGIVAAWRQMSVKVIAPKIEGGGGGRRRGVRRGWRVVATADMWTAWTSEAHNGVDTRGARRGGLQGGKSGGAKSIRKNE